jgi:hydrogenase 3 maturation protease
MPLTLKLLENRLISLRDRGERVAFVGIGSENHGDDAAGILAVKLLRAFPLTNVLAISGGTAPENVTGEVKRFKPALVVFIDALRGTGVPGAILEISKDDISGFSFSTHSLPLSVIIDYLAGDLCAEFIVIGIQGYEFRFGEEVSEAVSKSVKELVDSVKCVLKHED